MISLLTNTTSLDAQRNLNATQDSLSSSIEKLSSGMRINSASDDAAGLGISQSMKADISSLGQASENANDGISMSQVAEGAMNSMQGIVSRMRELAVQSSNQTLDSTDRSYIQTEYTQLSSEINRISATTSFSGQNLLDGSASTGLTFQVGINNTSNDRISMSITKLTTSTLGSTSMSLGSASLSTATNAQKAIAVFDKAIQQLSTARAKIGAVQNRLQVTISNLSTTTQNLSSAESQITDTDIASETSNMTQQQVLQQAGVSVLAQANQLPQAALKLLQG
ncbi:MAG TPA: flagellin [Kofleriaceae bacterium]|jgi:flagellin|nr:flagellin [Kofleriaceae bacterium]